MKDENWKLKLRYGKLTTPFSHYTILADGIVGELKDGFECRKGRAWISMKAWAVSNDEAIDMMQYVSEQIGFSIDGRIEVYTTDPVNPPKEKPYGYDILFTPYDEQ